jgi:hypothetical protein
MADYILRHPRTQMLLAKKQRPKGLRLGSGFGQDYKWVRTVEEATRFPCYVHAEEPVIFLGLADYEIRPLLSCGLLGDPVSRDEALKNGTYNSGLLYRDSGSRRQAETGTGSGPKDRQSGPKGIAQNPSPEDTPNASS